MKSLANPQGPALLGPTLHGGPPRPPGGCRGPGVGAGPEGGRGYPLRPQYRDPGAGLGTHPGPAAGGPGSRRAAAAPRGGSGGGPGPAPAGAFHPHPPGPGAGRHHTPAQVEDLSRQVARELALVGINVNLAPVLDVARCARTAPSGTAPTFGPDDRARIRRGRHPGLSGRRGAAGGQTFSRSGGHPGRLPRGAPHGPIRGCPAGRRTCCPSGWPWPRGCPWS